jgi:P-type conjugative transfer protein TrbL
MKRILLLLSLTVLCIYSGSAFAEVSQVGSLTGKVQSEFLAAAYLFYDRVIDYAKNLFWILATISLTWTAIEMAFKRAEFGEIVAELCKFIITTGFFFWLVTNGPEWANDIFDGLETVAAKGALNISSIDNKLVGQIIATGMYQAENVLGCSINLEWDDIGANLTLIIVAFAVFLIFIFVGLRVFILQIQIICQIYAGCFFLGFGGCRWTRDTSINYFKSIIASSSQFFALFIIAIVTLNITSELNNSLLSQMVNAAKNEEQIFEHAFTLLITPLALLFISATLPGAIASTISGNFHSANQNLAHTMSNMAQSTARTINDSSTARAIGRNIPGSQFASKAAGSILNVARHPINTAGAISNWMSGTVGAYKGSKQARTEARQSSLNSQNQKKENSLEGTIFAKNKQPENNQPKTSSDINTSLNKSDEKAVNDPAKMSSGQEQSKAKPSESSTTDMSRKSLDKQSVTGSVEQEQSDKTKGNNESLQSIDNLTPESEVTPESVLSEAKQQYNSGYCSQKDEENALQTAQNLANDDLVPQSVKEQASELANNIEKNKEENNFNRASSGKDTTHRTGDEESANSQRYTNLSKNWSDSANTPMGMLNRAKGLYKAGTAPKADEQKALMTAMSLASDKNIPNFVRNEAQKLASEIQRDRDSNATWRSDNGIDNTSLSQDAIQQYTQALNSEKSGFYNSGSSEQKTSTDTNSSQPKTNLKTQSDEPKSAQSINSEDGTSHQNTNANISQPQSNHRSELLDSQSEKNNKSDSVAEQDRDTNQFSTTKQVQDRPTLVQRNKDTLAALWDATGAKGLRYINDHQPFHMINSYRAGHEMAREKTEQKLDLKK